jgi:hypothetical protein
VDKPAHDSFDKDASPPADEPEGRYERSGQPGPSMITAALAGKQEPLFPSHRWQSMAGPRLLDWRPPLATPRRTEPQLHHTLVAGHNPAHNKPPTTSHGEVPSVAQPFPAGAFIGIPRLSVETPASATVQHRRSSPL